MRTNRSVLLVIPAALLLSSLPYIFGYSLNTPESRFTGLTYNIDDACVYLSWIRQAADGHFFIRNQFAIESQGNLQFNILFLALGWIARLPHIPLIGVFHLARLVFGALLLFAIYRFSGFFLEKQEHRLAVLIVAAFSSGVGWLFGGGTDRSLPVDMWQPEAITFLSLYLNPLFLCAQILMVASLAYLLRARETGMARHALAAGAFLLLLANIHTYDVLTVGVVWIAYLIASSAAEMRLNLKTILLSCLAALIAAPALLYQWRLYNAEEVFRLRVQTETLSPAIWSYLAGYGIVLLLAAAALPAIIKRRDRSLLLAVWAVVGFLLPYAPLMQQRKLVMGLHIPLAMLAVYTLISLSRRARLPLVWAAILLALIAIPSNILFMWRDAKWLAQNETATRMHRPFLDNSEVSALKWLDRHARDTDTVLAFPDVACFIPAFTGARTYVGHWSETPSFAWKLRVWRAFVESDTSDDSRLNFLRRWRISYVWWNTTLKELPGPDGSSTSVFNPDKKPYLQKVFESGGIRVYQAVSR
ncbi:MAG: hypothetical protein Q7T82_09405 [Armatimonadota bacterium]|nr:hypothetical protein [Armatimonadota bacterium]